MRALVVHMYQWLLLAHLIGLAAFLGGSGAYSASVDRLARARSVAELRALLSVAALGMRLLTVGTPLLVLAGLALTADAWSFTQGWILTAIALVILQGAAGLFVGRRVDRLEAALEQAPDGPVPPALALLAGDRSMRAVDRAAIANLVELLFLMVAKPGAGGILLSLLVELVGAATLAATVLRPDRASVT